MTNHDCIHAADFQQLQQISGRVEVIQSDVADLKEGQTKQIETAAKTREGQARLEGRFDTLEKLITQPTQANPMPSANGNIKGMSMIMKVALAAFTVIGTALMIVAAVTGAG